MTLTVVLNWLEDALPKAQDDYCCKTHIDLFLSVIHSDHGRHTEIGNFSLEVGFATCCVEAREQIGYVSGPQGYHTGTIRMKLKK